MCCVKWLLRGTRKTNQPRNHQHRGYQNTQCRTAPQSKGFSSTSCCHTCSSLQVFLRKDRPCDQHVLCEVAVAVHAQNQPAPQPPTPRLPHQPTASLFCGGKWLLFPCLLRCCAASLAGGAHYPLPM